MITFKARIEKSREQGWSYVLISKKLVAQLKPGAGVSFRVKGTLDAHAIEKTSVLPMGDGRFMLPINAAMRKAIGKQAGNSLVLSLTADDRKPTLSKALMACLKEDPEALQFFKTLSPFNQRYYSKWIDDAKTQPTKTKRLTITLLALGRHMKYGEMLRALKTFTV